MDKSSTKAAAKAAAGQNSASSWDLWDGLAALLFLLVFSYHWFEVWAFAADIPFWDEWDMFLKDPTPGWIWAAHVEHRIVTTKLVISLLKAVNGWDIAFHQTLNFALFGVTLAVLGWMLNRVCGRVKPAIVLLFLTLVLSPRASEVHSWALAGHYHWALLFFFLAAGLLFPAEDEPLNWRAAVGGLVCGVLGLYSFGIALPATALLVLFFGLRQWLRAPSYPEAIKQAGLVCGGLSIALLCYRLGSGPPAVNDAMTLPNSVLFWNHYVTLLADGFGYKAGLVGSYMVAGLLAALCGWAWCEIWRRGERGQLLRMLGLALATLGILAALAGTTAGRARLGVEQAHVSRYTEVTMMLIPMLGVTLWVAFQQKARIRWAVLTLYCVFCGVGFIRSWPDMNNYAITYQIRAIEGRNLTACYVRGTACKVVNLSPEPVEPETLAEAARKGLSFMKKIQSRYWFMN